MLKWLKLMSIGLNWLEVTSLLSLRKNRSSYMNRREKYSLGESYAVYLPS